MSNARWILVALVASVALPACGSDANKDEGPSYEITDQALQGKINGEDWKFVSGYAEDKFGDGELWIELHPSDPTDGDPCGFSPFDSEPHIIVSGKAEEVDESLSLANNITFTYGEAENDISTKGRLVIDTVTDSKIGGGLYAEFSDSSGSVTDKVDGNWEVQICTDDSGTGTNGGTAM